jgi:hypothetical protein
VWQLQASTDKPAGKCIAQGNTTQPAQAVINSLLSCYTHRAQASTRRGVCCTTLLVCQPSSGKAASLCNSLLQCRQHDLHSTSSRQTLTHGARSVQTLKQQRHCYPFIPTARQHTSRAIH